LSRRHSLTPGLCLMLCFMLATGCGPSGKQAGIRASGDPVQSSTADRSWLKNGYTIHALAEFHIRALVVLTQRYWFDSMSALSPIDLLMAWGSMSDYSVLDKLSLSQGGRWYHSRWYSPKPPLNEEAMNDHIANMHMIPASDAVKSDLLEIQEGEVVELAGFLIEAEGPRGWRVRSSLTRTDSGAGACEVVWVEHVLRVVGR
jgi:hypothetical protein